MIARILDDAPGRRKAAISHLLMGRGKYVFQHIGVTASSVPLLEFTQPVELSLHGYGIR
jgi:hypothetical protein